MTYIEDTDTMQRLDDEELQQIIEKYKKLQESLEQAKQQTEEAKSEGDTDE